jgi:hypothetical protein
MRILYLVIGLALLSSTLLCSGASLGATNITVAINSTSQYIESVNESAYLVFYPNLTGAYAALNASMNASHTNTTKAYALLGLARSSADAAQRRIFQYYSVSFYVLAVISIVLAAALYVLMRKPQKVRK